jgi:hypothetical protein
MKKFSQFIKEANKPNFAKLTAMRLGLVPDGHGGWYNPKTGEYEGESETESNGIRIKFSNKNQRAGKRDPDQDRSKPSPLVPASHQVSEEYEKNLREKYINGEIFNEGDLVENLNNGLVGKIIRRGTNYLICVTEDSVMFKPWIKDVIEWTDKSGVPADQRETGTDSYRQYTMDMTGTKKIKDFNIRKFINKYKVNRK